MTQDGYSQVRLPPRRPTPNGVRGQYRQIRAGVPRSAPVAQQARQAMWTQVRDQPRFSQVNTPNAYATQRLGMLQRNSGFDPASLGIGGNAAAQWRAISPLAGVYAAIRGGHAADYQAPANMHPAVAAIVNQLLAAALHPDNLGSRPSVVGGPVAY